MLVEELVLSLLVKTFVHAVDSVYDDLVLGLSSIHLLQLVNESQ